MKAILNPDIPNRCGDCGKSVNEGYFLQAQNEEEYEWLEKKFPNEEGSPHVCETCMHACNTEGFDLRIMSLNKLIGTWKKGRWFDA